MEIDWQNATFELQDTEISLLDTTEQKSIFNQLQNHPVKRSRKELEEYYSNNTEAIRSKEDDEYYIIEESVDLDDKSQIQQIPKDIQILTGTNEFGATVYLCSTCSLDFSSVQYYIRHIKAKKHKVALDMEQRGRKMKQRKVYKRKDENLGQRFYKSKKKSEDQQQAEKQIQEASKRQKSNLAINQPKLSFNELLQPVVIDDQSQLSGISVLISREPASQNNEDILKLNSEEEKFVERFDKQISNYKHINQEQDETAKGFYNLEPVEEPAAKVQKLSDLDVSFGSIINFDSILNEADLIPSIDDIDVHPMIMIENEDVQQYPNVEELDSKSEAIIEQVQKAEQIKTESTEPELPIINSTDQNPFVIEKLIMENFESTPKSKHPLMLNIDGPIAKIQCQQCPKTFRLQGHYTQHMNSAHTKGKNFKCPLCGKKFSNRKTCELHISKHNPHAKQYKCTKCPKAYIVNCDLRRHEKSHQEIFDYTCDLCGKGFLRGDHLENHFMAHDRQEKRFLERIKVANESKNVIIKIQLKEAEKKFD